MNVGSDDGHGLVFFSLPFFPFLAKTREKERKDQGTKGRKETALQQADARP